jgi:hypothetical protein
MPQTPAPRLRAYQRETVVAEKFHAMVERGIANSRMKDYFDLWFFTESATPVTLAAQTNRPTSNILSLKRAVISNSLVENSFALARSPGCNSTCKNRFAMVISPQKPSAVSNRRKWFSLGTRLECEDSA